MFNFFSWYKSTQAFCAFLSLFNKFYPSNCLFWLKWQLYWPKAPHIFLCSCDIFNAFSNVCYFVVDINALWLFLFLLSLSFPNLPPQLSILWTSPASSRLYPTFITLTIQELTPRYWNWRSHSFSHQWLYIHKLLFPSFTYVP